MAGRPPHTKLLQISLYNFGDIEIWITATSSKLWLVNPKLATWLTWPSSFHKWHRPCDGIDVTSKPRVHYMPLNWSNVLSCRQYAGVNEVIPDVFVFLERLWVSRRLSWLLIVIEKVVTSSTDRPMTVRFHGFVVLIFVVFCVSPHFSFDLWIFACR